MSRRREEDEKGSKVPSRFRVERGDGDTFRVSTFGPSLPAEFQQQKDEEEDDIGPALPPGFRQQKEEEEEEDDIGPALPPGFRQQKEEDEEAEEQEGGIWPSLPPEFSRSGTAGGSGRSPARNDAGNNDDEFFGPALPPGFALRAPIFGPTMPAGVTARDDSDSDEEIIGPMPAQGPVQFRVAEEFERRAQRMKDKLLGKTDDTPVVREAWMMELPDDVKTFGLGPRSFRRKAAPETGDRSVWTDTPVDRERRAAEGAADKAGGSGKKQKRQEVSEPSERDLQLAKAVAVYNDTNRGVSLMDQHKQKRKRKAGEEAAGPPPPRRPFDRDVDLQGGRVDGRKRQDIIDKSRLLGSRFSHGNSRMFL